MRLCMHFCGQLYAHTRRHLPWNLQCMSITIKSHDRMASVPLCKYTPELGVWCAPLTCMTKTTIILAFSPEYIQPANCFSLRLLSVMHHQHDRQASYRIFRNCDNVALYNKSALVVVFCLFVCLCKLPLEECTLVALFSQEVYGYKIMR